MLLDRQTLRLLYELGLMAASGGDPVRAEKIFSALELTRPDSPAGYVGRAMTYMYTNSFAEALAVLDRGLALMAPQDQPELHAFRGMALQLAGRTAESLQAFRAAGDLPMARALLGEPLPEPEAATEGD
jgi:tetratricopeptide (TPR) repeat protein